MIHHLNPPESSKLGDASNVCRYQKYSVSDDFRHSSASVLFGPLDGHDAHGSGNYCFITNDIIIIDVKQLTINLRLTYTKTIYEVIETPGDDNIIINSNKQCDNT